MWLVLDIDQPVARGQTRLWMQAQSRAQQARREYNRRLMRCIHKNA